MTRTASQPTIELARITTIGSTFGFKVSALLARLRPLGDECGDHLVVTVPHGFDRLAARTLVALDRLREVCDVPWAAEAERLAGSGTRVALELETIPAKPTEVVTRVRIEDADLTRVDPAVIAAARPALDLLGAENLRAVELAGADDWTFVIAQPNTDEPRTEATRRQLDRVAELCGVTAAQRRIAGELHGSLARGMVSHARVRVAGGALEPEVGVVWDRVEWRPIQSMLAGFYPAGDPLGRVTKLSRASDVDDASIEIRLGTGQAPAMRIAMRIAG